MEQKKVVTRFAPSPTGKLHSGAYRTAIFSYLFARKNNGKFILRIEDTDKERSTKENEGNILESLNWLGLEYDEFFRQSENVNRHKEILEKMIGDGHAYISKEEAKDGSGIIKEIVRFKNPNEDVSFVDEIKGLITMHTADLGDFVIAKNINEPLFHLAVVVDDFDEGVTHIIRGEDHVSNTPRQILIQRAIGAPTPIYAHLPLVLGDDKQKLSKRKGALAITEYREQGYLPEALLNMVSMVGWNPGTEQELFSKEELIKEFDLAKVHKSPAVFNQEKLNWLNKEYIKKLNTEVLKNKIFEFLPIELQNEKLIPIISDRITKFSDIKEMVANKELDFFINAPAIDISKINYKDTAPEKTKEYLENVIKILESIPDFNLENIKNTIMEYANTLPSRGEVLHPMRFTLSGLEKSPDPFTIASILGKNETISRLQKAI
ncbi:MAG: glutamate--tRNA ligase [Patescibacteria group bacterium]